MKPRLEAAIFSMFRGVVFSNSPALRKTSALRSEYLKMLVPHCFHSLATLSNAYHNDFRDIGIWAGQHIRITFHDQESTVGIQQVND